MARIRCKYVGCTFLDEGFCTATIVELDPDEGCLTFAQVGDPFEDDDDWGDEDDLDGYEEWDDEDDLSDSLFDDEDDY